jgi:uncharacterized delta-60 repeat protein
MSRITRTRRASLRFISVGCLLTAGAALVSAPSWAAQSRPALPAGQAVHAVLTTSAKAGSLDSTFGQDGSVISDTVLSEYVQAMTVQADHKILVSGYQEDSDGVPHFLLRRFDASGKPDLSFGTGGRVVTAVRQAAVADQALAVAVQPDGKILVAGYVFSRSHHTDFALLRYTPAGTLDKSFGALGKAITTVGDGFSLSGAHAVVVQPDGHILVAGIAQSASKASKVALLRYTAAGSLDPSFGDHGVTTTAFGASTASDATTMVPLKDGRILVAGSTNSATSPGGFALLRYLASGKLDPSFGKQGKVMTVVGLSSGDHAAVARTVSVLPDGGILLTGFAWVTANGEPAVNIGVAKYRADGSPDPSFGTGGNVVTTGSHGLGFQASTALPSGNFMVIGNVFTADSTNDYSFLRYLPDGKLDRTYGPDKNGVVPLEATESLLQISSLFRQSDGKIVIAGSVDVKGVSHVVLARFNP